MRLEARLKGMEQAIMEIEAVVRSRNLIHERRVQEAISDTFIWTTQYTQTYNEHWVEEGRLSPHEPFPPFDCFAVLYTILDSERIAFIEKSRDLMISWACVAYLTLQAMKVPQRGVLFQTLNEQKSKQLVKYAKTLYDRQAPWLKEAFPLSKPLRRQADLSLEFANGSYIQGIPAGANQIRSYHPWGYLLDEASFVHNAGECFNAALAVAKGKIILNSSAGPGWYADVRRDIIRNNDH